MSTFHDEAAMAHGAGNPKWLVEYRDAEGGNPVQIEVGATDREQAINKASQRLNTTDVMKPARQLYFRSANRVGSETRGQPAPIYAAGQLVHQSTD